MLNLIITLIAVGICLFALNKWGPTFINATIIKIINIVVVCIVVVWLLNVFGILSRIGNVPVPHV